MTPVGRRRRPSPIRRPHAMRWAFLFNAAIFLLLGVGLVIGGVTNATGSLLGDTALLAGGAAVLATAEWIRRSVRPEGPQLAVSVGPDEITFEHPGEVAGRVRRGDAGLVVLGLQPGRFGGMVDITVWSASGALLGRWDTNWLGKGVMAAYRNLGRHGWPRAIADSFTGKMRWVSRDAPPWVGRRRGLGAYLHPATIAFHPEHVDWAAFSDSLDHPPPAAGGSSEALRRVELTARWPRPPLTIDLSPRWCVLTDDPEHNAVEGARFADSLMIATPGLYGNRESLLEGLTSFAILAYDGALLAVTCEEDARFGMVWPTIRMKVTERPSRLLGPKLFARVYQVADALGGTRYRPRVRPFTAVRGGQRLHAVRQEASGVAGEQEPVVLLRHWIPVEDERFTVELETTTTNLVTAPALAAEVDAAAASITAG